MTESPPRSARSSSTAPVGHSAPPSVFQPTAPDFIPMVQRSLTDLAEQPAASNTETSSVEAPAVEAPAVEAPAVEAPAVEALVVETPVVETPAIDTQAINKHVPGTSAVSKVEPPVTNRHVHEAKKVQHKPSKSGPIPESELSKLQVETGIAGPSRLPNRVSQQTPAPSRPLATVTEVPHDDHHLHGQLAPAPQAQQKKKKGADQKPKNGWSHTRNDPIHGPISQHNKQPQGSSKAVTLQPSNPGDNRTTTQKQNYDPQCPNYNKSGPRAVYEHCECFQCDRRNRSLIARFAEDVSWTPSMSKPVEDYLRQHHGVFEGIRIRLATKYQNPRTAYMS